MKKSNKLLILSIALLSALASCGGSTTKEDPPPVDQVESFTCLAEGSYVKEPTPNATDLDLAKVKEIEEGTSEFTLTINEVDSNFDFHTDIQKKYLESSSYEILPSGVKGEEALDRPIALELNWSNNIKDSKVVSLYKLYLGEDENFSSPLIYETIDTKLDLYNLKLGTHYYYRVDAIVGSKTFSSNTYSFTTMDTPVRNLYIDGVVNARDLGGWTTTSGKKVKQGLVYRTGRLNKNRMNIVQKQITSKGMRVMNEDLKMKSEIDLRQRENNEVGSLKSSPLGKHVNYYNTPMEYDFDGLNNAVKLKNMIKEVFTIFSKPSNLPAFFHCSIGTDRTGMIAYMLNGLLGVSQEDLLKDYMFSNFGYIKDTRDPEYIKTNYVKYLDEYRGETLEEKIANYLLDIGISQEQIDSIRDTMLEK